MCFVNLLVNAAAALELIVGAFLNDPAPVQYDDLIRSAEGGDVFSRRKAEDAYTLLRNAGFCLYHAVDGWNAWTPYEEYCELMKRGLVTEPMQALVFDRNRRYMREMLTKPE